MGGIRGWGRDSAGEAVGEGGSPSVKPSGLQSDCMNIRGYRPEIDRAQEQVLATLERLGYPDAARFAVRLAMEEALTNAFHHGHKGLPPDETVRMEYRATPDQIEIIVEDKGPGFNPNDVPDPTRDENLEIPTGRGLLLMRAYMAEVEYLGRGNRVRMVYRVPSAVGGPQTGAQRTC